MGSDAVNAPVEERHRIEAVRSSFWDGAPPTWALEWARTGKGTAPLAVTIHHAQSLANLEAAVRREYAGLEAYRECCTGLVFVAIHVRDLEEAPRWLRAKAVMELDKVRLVDTEQFELSAELEKLNDGK